jgi:hypothetical protein
MTFLNMCISGRICNTHGKISVCQVKIGPSLLSYALEVEHGGQLVALHSTRGRETTTTVTGNQKPRLFCASITGISGTMGVV